MTRHTRQLENGKSDVHPGGIVEAIHKPTGARATYYAVEVGGELVMRPMVASEHSECKLDDLVLIRVVRRGFGK